MESRRQKTTDLLPGVSHPDSSSRIIATRIGKEVIAARRKASFRDLADFTILVAIDVLFVVWNGAQIPFVSRSTSAWVLILVNLAWLGHWLVMRLLPRLRAQQIAQTWSADEQRRFRRNATPD